MRFTVRVVVLGPRGHEPATLHVVVLPLDPEAERFDVWPLDPLTLCGKYPGRLDRIEGLMDRCEKCLMVAAFMDTALAVLDRLKGTAGPRPERRGWAQLMPERPRQEKARTVRDRCRRGHPRTPENVRETPQGTRCRACERIAEKKRNRADVA